MALLFFNSFKLVLVGGKIGYYCAWITWVVLSFCDSSLFTEKKKNCFARACRPGTNKTSSSLYTTFEHDNMYFNCNITTKMCVRTSHCFRPRLTHNRACRARSQNKICQYNTRVKIAPEDFLVRSFTGLVAHLLHCKMTTHLCLLRSKTATFNVLRNSRATAALFAAPNVNSGSSSRFSLPSSHSQLLSRRWLSSADIELPPAPTSLHSHTPIEGAKGRIIYTETDEAPALATVSRRCFVCVLPCDFSSS